MTTLKQKIQSDYLEAFKSKNALVKNLLSVVKGEIQMQEKNTIVESLSDDEVIKILNKFAKNAKENIQALKNCIGCSTPWYTALINTGILYIIIWAIYRFTYLLLSYLKKNSEQLSSNKKQKK